MTIHTQKHLPLVRLDQPGVHYSDGRPVVCDYCPEPAQYYHWADQRGGEAAACGQHVSILNKYYR